MTAENLKPSAPEAHDIQTPNGFLRELFDRTKQMIEQEKGGKTMAELGEHDFRRWFAYSDYIHSTSYTPFEMERGILSRSERYDYGLAIGKTIGRYPDLLSVEFGLIPHSNRNFDDTLDRWNVLHEDREKEEKAREYLQAIVTQHGVAHGSGRFYADSFTGGIRSDCWADAYMYGGKEVGRGNWTQEQILTEAGLTAAVDVFRQVAERAWRR